MFSSRLRCSFEGNRLSEAIAGRRASGAEFFDLTISNPTQAGIPYPAAEILNALDNKRSLAYDPDPKGLLQAREAIARRYDFDPAHLVLTASTSEAYSFLFKLLCDPGDAVLVPQPSYPLFDFLADLESVRIRHYPLFYDGGWAIDVAALQDALTPQSRAVVLVNPNNPTGSFVKRSEYSELARICRSAGVAIISDEVFGGYAFASDSGRVATLNAQSDVLTFCLDGLSKAAGMPQMKLGWIAVSGPQKQVDPALLRLELIADTFLSVNTPVQLAAATLLDIGRIVRERICNRTRRNLQVLRRVLATTMFRVLDVEGGWYAIVQAPRTMTEEQWVLNLFERRGVLLQPGYFYDFRSEAFLVASLLTPEEVFEKGVRRVAAFDEEPRR